MRLFPIILAVASSCTRPNPAFRVVGASTTDAGSPDLVPDTLMRLDAAGADAGGDARIDSGAGALDQGGAEVAPVRLMLDRSIYVSGEAIVATFSNGPGSATDWIGIYEVDDPAPAFTNPSTAWYYTNNFRVTLGGSGPRNGAVIFTTGSAPTWPLAAGLYKAIFLAGDGYVILAGPVDFEVR
jgi:hypothetical protein